MKTNRNDFTIGALILGLCLVAGLAELGWFASEAVVKFRELERSVTVKGLAEREVPADIVIWPIRFTAASNDLGALYGSIESSTTRIDEFLKKRGIAGDEISSAIPSINDKSAQAYGDSGSSEFRYTAVQTVTVYSDDVDTVRQAMNALSELGKSGIVFAGNEYEAPADYLFTELNTLKPDMIEEATRNAREVGEKFAADSDSRLGRIRTASQGQFSISPRDRNNPHIKLVRVVSTVEYYLAD